MEQKIITAVLIGSYTGFEKQTKYLHRKFEEEGFYYKNNTVLLTSLIDAEEYLRRSYSSFCRFRIKEHLLLHVATYESFLKLEQLENKLFRFIPIVFSFDGAHQKTDLPTENCLKIELHDFSQIQDVITIDLAERVAAKII
jgi:hypothetical protein